MFHNDYEYLIQKYGEKLGKEKYEKRLKNIKKQLMLNLMKKRKYGI
jgi:hypothetical protein